MPMPPGPRRDWRPVVERVAGVTINTLMAAAALKNNELPSLLDALGWVVIAPPFPLLGVIGFLLRRPASRKS
jgi:hypothetical protein